MRIIDASGIIKPHFALVVVEGGGLDSGIVLGPRSGIEGLGFCTTL